MDTRDWLALHQRLCPVCGRSVCSGDALHHWLIRRMKGKPELDIAGYNLLLIHNATCHVPEPPGLGRKCARFVFEHLGITPQEIEEWRDALPFKVSPALPGFYYEIRKEIFGY